MLMNRIQRLLPDLPGTFFRASVRPQAAKLIASEVDFAKVFQALHEDHVKALAAADSIAAEAAKSRAKALATARASRFYLNQIGAAVEVRLALADRMCMPELVRYVQHLQGRYASIVSATTYARYNSQTPKDVFEKEDLLRAELKTLSYRLRLAYSITHIKDEYLFKIRRNCSVLLFLSFMVIFSAIWFQVSYGKSWPQLNFALIAVTGFGGAVTSISRRANQIISSNPLDDDPIVEASALQNGSASLWIAALTGPIFASILLIIFMTGTFALGGVEPRFVPLAAGRPASGYDFEVFGRLFRLGESAGPGAVLVH